MKTATDLPYYRWTPLKQYIPTCPNVAAERWQQQQIYPNKCVTQYVLLSAVLMWQRTEGDSNTFILPTGGH